MEDLENGYYWVSYKGMSPVIFEKDGDTWYAMGVETEADLSGHKVLQKVEMQKQPTFSVMKFADWVRENNDMLNEKGCDVMGCVKEWEKYLTEQTF